MSAYNCDIVIKSIDSAIEQHLALKTFAKQMARELLREGVREHVYPLNYFENEAKSFGLIDLAETPQPDFELIETTFVPNQEKVKTAKN